jgi:hypothetical protein
MADGAELALPKRLMPSHEIQILPWTSLSWPFSSLPADVPSQDAISLPSICVPLLYKNILIFKGIIKIIIKIIISRMMRNKRINMADVRGLRFNGAAKI